MRRASSHYWFPVLALCTFFVQPTSAQSEAASFGALVLQDGLPAGLPEKLAGSIQQRFKNVQHVVIPTGRATDYVAYYQGEVVDEGFPPRWLWHARADSTGQLKGVSFKAHAEDMLAAALELYTDMSQAEMMPLELRLLPESNVLLYRWPGSNTGAGGTAAAQESDRVKVGQPLSDFQVERLEGGTLSLSSFKGYHLVINTWAISCSPCIAEMPGLNQLAEKYKNKNIVFLALGHDSKAEINAFLETHPFSYEQALFNERISELFGEAFPRNVIVHADGIVVYDRTGANEEQHEQLDKVIQEKLILSDRK